MNYSLPSIKGALSVLKSVKNKSVEALNNLFQSITGPAVVVSHGNVKGGRIINYEKKSLPYQPKTKIDTLQPPSESKGKLEYLPTYKRTTNYHIVGYNENLKALGQKYKENPEDILYFNPQLLRLLDINNIYSDIIKKKTVIKLPPKGNKLKVGEEYKRRFRYGEN